MKNAYTKQYYETSNYANYSERGERYCKLAKETTTLLESLSILDKDSNIIDFGCATGHLIFGLKNLNYKNIFGVEISDWAREQCLNNNFSVVSSINEIEHNLNNKTIIYVLDVLEHMTDAECGDFFEKTKNCSIVLRIPVASSTGENFALEVSRKDPTHINCKTKKEWSDFILNFRDTNTKILRLNLNTIYDSLGVMSVLII